MGRSVTPELPSSMYGCIVCGMMGELTKLCAYGFQFWFQVPLHLSGRSRQGSSTSRTHDSAFENPGNCTLTLYYFTLWILKQVTMVLWFDVISVMFCSNNFTSIIIKNKNYRSQVLECYSSRSGFLVMRFDN